MSRKVYKCELSDNLIEMEINNDKIALFDVNVIDPPNIKLYILLLKKCIDELTSLGVKKIVQTVTEEDWETILSKDNNWKLVRINPFNNYYIVGCNIENALEAIVKGFGF